jgi:antitoxin YefM
MTAVNYSTLRGNFALYCNRVADQSETVIVTRKDERNVVLISMEEYNSLVRFAKNAEYLAMLDRSLAQIEQGETVAKTMEELEAME